MAFSLLLSPFFLSFQLRQQFPAKAAGGIEEDEQQWLPSLLRQSAGLSRPVGHFEGWCFGAERQAFRLSGFTEFELIQAFFQFVEPHERSSVLPQQLPAQPTAGQDGQPGEWQRQDQVMVHSQWLYN
jgi:hypothetical protein